jgi:L-cysteine/cystine lyase
VNHADARARFPVLERLAYLNAGTFGPLARETIEAMSQRLLHDVEQGRGGKPYYDEMIALRDDVRGRVAELICVDKENVALTTSTTDGCNIAVSGLGLEPGDEIVTTDSEHFGLIGPLQASPAQVRVAAVGNRPPEDHLALILEQVTPRTRLIALSHVTWTTGAVLPVAELKEHTDVPLLVDGAQSVGAIPVDASRADYYTVSGQKWLCGPEATGALYVRDPEALRVAAPSYFAQQRYSLDEPFEPRAGATRFDAGWTPLAALEGWRAALELAPEWRYAHSAEMSARLYALLEDAGYDVVTPPGGATLLSVRLADPDAAAAAVERCWNAGVVVRDLPGLGLVRASCGWWTSDDDLQRFLGALAA